MLGAISSGLDAVSSALGGPKAAGAAADSPMQFYKGENLGEPEQNLAGAQAPEDTRPIDGAAIIEFIHIGHVHPDTSRNYHHDKKKDDIVETFPNKARLRAFQFRAALHREAMLLSCFMTATKSVMEDLEKTKGGVGEMVGMAADMLGAGSGSSSAPKPSDVDAMGTAVQTAAGKVNTEAAKYADIHQCGIDLHQARTNYRAFLKKLGEKPPDDADGGLLGKLPVVGGVIPPAVKDILNFVTGLAFKPMDVYLAFYLKLANEMEPAIEKATRKYTVDALMNNTTPAFYLWYPAPEAPAEESGGSGGGGTGIPFLDAAKRQFDDAKSKVENFGKDVQDFLSAGVTDTPPPGLPFLEQAFMTQPPEPAAAGAAAATPVPPKEVSQLVLSGFKAGLGINSLPSFIERIILEITTVNNEFLREVYKKLMERPAVQPINELEMYEAARMRLLDRLVALVMENIDFLRTVKDFQVNAQGMNTSPGAALLDKGLDELNEEVFRRLNVVMELTMGELVDKLEGLRQQCVKSNAIAMEAYLGFFPWLLALNFRNTFLPVWQLIMDNTFGKAAGPLGDVVKQARDAMNSAKKKVDDARTTANRIQRIKDRATRDGLQMGSSGQNLTGYRQDLKAELPPDQEQPTPAPVQFFPFSARKPEAKGEDITKSEYDTVKAKHKWDLAVDPNAASA